MARSNLRQLFNHFDRDNNGELTLNEVRQMLMALGRVEPSLQINDQVANEWLNLVDKDNNQSVSYDEFLNTISKYLVKNDVNRENLRKQFYSFDVKLNGKLDRREFQNFMKAVYGYMNDGRFQYKDSVADTFFNDLDDDGNGEISFDEFYLYINGVLRAHS